MDNVHGYTDTQTAMKIIRHYPVVAIDFETTGLSPEQHAAVEIALVKRYPSGETEHWSSLIKPPHPISVASQSVHHISDAMVEHAPTFKDIYPDIERMLTGSIVIAHNAPFDMNFLAKEIERAQLPSIDILYVLDTLKIARSFFGLPQNNLSFVSQRFNLSTNNAHRALPDAHNTLQIFFHMLTDIEGREEKQLTCMELQELVEKHHKAGEIKKQIVEDISVAHADQLPISIDYISRDPNKPIRSQRIISIKNLRLPFIEAFCHLRQAERVFHIKQIQRAEIVDETAIVSELQKNTEDASDSE